MAITAEVAEDAAAARLAAAAKQRKPGGVREAHGRRAAAVGTPPVKSPVFSLYERLALLFRDNFGLKQGLFSAALPSEDDADALQVQAVVDAWTPIEKRLQRLALAGLLPVSPSLSPSV